MSWLSKLRSLIDPRGPLGAVASPSDIYKERLGLPIAAPHTVRAALAAPKEHLAHGLAAPRFISLADGAGVVPRERVRAVTAYVEEVWAPVYRSTDSTDLAVILKASQEQIGWTVTQRESQQSRAARRAAANAADFVEIAQHAQIQASDAFYDGYYETVPGNDPVIVDGEILKAQDGTIIRGGTQIRGRTEYNQKTKGMVHWDVGTVKERMVAQAEMESRPVRNVAANLERVAGEVLPMRRLAHNPRYDRRSAV